MGLFRLLGYRRRWLLLSLFRRRPVSLGTPIVIGGCPRSGTTLVRVLLGRHPQIAAGFESTVFEKRISSPARIGPPFGFDPATVVQWQRESRSQVEFVERFQAAVLAASGKQIWADKTPGNVLRFGFVRRHFPNAWLIHVVRDGRDVVCSFRTERWPKPCGKPGSLDELRRSARYWAHQVRSGRRLAGDRRYFELRYEELIRDPARVLRQLIEVLGLEWSNELMLDRDSIAHGLYDRPWGAIDDAAVGRWRRELRAEEQQAVFEVIGDDLIELGYETDLRCGGAPPHRRKHRSRRICSFKRWARFERAWIETVAAWRAIRDPRMPWWPKLIALSLAAAYLDFVPDHVAFAGRFDALAAIPAAFAVAAAASPQLMREKRRAVKRLLAHSESRPLVLMGRRSGMAARQLAAFLASSIRRKDPTSLLGGISLQ